MSANDAIAIGHWTQNGQEIFAVAYAAALENLNQSDPGEYIQFIWGKASVFSTIEQALKKAYDMDFRMSTESGIRVIPFKTEIPAWILNRI